jgi:hypothetical protein
VSRRIRTLKPEILDNPRTAKLSHAAWRLFVSAIVLADDYGNVGAEPAWLGGAAFWGRPADVAGALDDLAASGLVERYEVRGQAYMHIAGWAQHQRVDHPGKPMVPGPSSADARPSGTFARPSGTFAGDQDQDQDQDHPVVSGETTCGSSLRCDLPEDLPVSKDLRARARKPRVTAEMRDPRVVEVLAAHNAARKARLPSSRACILDAPRARAIAARLAEGYTVEDLSRAAKGHFASDHHLGANVRGTRYLDPALCYRDAAHVDQFLDMAPAPSPPREEPTVNGGGLVALTAAEIALMRGLGA